MFTEMLNEKSSFMKLSLEARAVFMMLITLSGDGNYPGEVKVTDRMGYTHEQLSDILKVDKSILLRVLSEIEANCMISVTNGVITIKNWEKYQSEYQRQKPYRIDGKKKKKRLQTKLQDKLLGEGDVEGDVDKEEKEETNNTLCQTDFEASVLAVLSKCSKINFSLMQLRKISNYWEELQKSGVDIETQLRRADAWLVTNNRIKKNYIRFLTNWLNRTLDKGGSYGGGKVSIGSGSNRLDAESGKYDKFSPKG